MAVHAVCGPGTFEGVNESGTRALMDETERPRHTEDELFEVVKELTNGWAKRRMIRDAIRAGRIKPTRVGHRSLYSDQDAVDFVRSLKVTA